MRNVPAWCLPVLGALAMSVGWGYRGDYGHESGALMPGALMGLAVALAGGRRDWAERASLLGLLGAIGWAFGGQMSYGLLIGYTTSDSAPDVAFGYGAIGLIGGLWGAIGCGVLALGVSEPRSRLERFAGPLVLVYLAWWGMTLSGQGGKLQERWPIGDSDWLAATVALAVGGAAWLAMPKAREACGLIVVLAGGWWVGYLVLVVGLGLRVNPPRSENWGACVGLAAALAAWHARRGNRLVLWLMAIGLLAGGLGFVLGDFANMLSRAKWGPIGASPTLAGMNSWKWMEQGFGLVMGLIVGWAFGRVARAPAVAVVDDEPAGPWRVLAPFFLLVLVPWENFWKNVREWLGSGTLRDGMFGIGPEWWAAAVGVALSAAVLYAIVRVRSGRLAMAPATGFGRGQLLFLCVVWTPALAALLNVLPGIATISGLFVHVSFWLTATLASVIVIGLDEPDARVEGGKVALEDRSWRPGRALAVAVVIGGVVIGGVSWATLSAFDGPARNTRYRFGTEAEGRK